MAGEYVQLSLSYGSQTVFQVNSLGDGTFGSDLYVFNIYNIGYTGNTFTDNKVGTFKKIIDSTNSGETMSSYYVKMHKVLTNANDLVVTKTGFEEVPFANNKKFEFSSLTPNNISRISQKNASTTYSFTTNVKYDNKTVDVTEDLAGSKFVKGTYTVNVFDKAELVSRTSFSLR